MPISNEDLQAFDHLNAKVVELADSLDDDARYNWDEQNEEEMQGLLAKYEEFMTLCADLEETAEKLDPSGRDSHISQAVDAMYNRRSYIKGLDEALKSDLAALSKMGPAVDEKVLRTLYGIMKRGYDNSYAMMVDDAMNAGKKYAEKNGISLFWDAGVFPEMFTHIRSHRNWDSLSKQVKAEFSRAARKT